MCYIGIRYIGEFSMIVFLLKKIKKREKKKKAMHLMRYSKYYGARG